MESKIGPATLQSPRPRKQAETHDCLSIHTAEPTNERICRPTSPSAQHPFGGVIGEEDHGAAAVASPPSAITPPLSPHAQNAALEEQEWEISKIVGKRRAGKGYEYKVRWRSTWLSKSDFGNVQRLLQEFEARARLQRGSKPSIPTRTEKDG